MENNPKVLFLYQSITFFIRVKFISTELEANIKLEITQIILYMRSILYSLYVEIFRCTERYREELKLLK